MKLYGDVVIAMQRVYVVVVMGICFGLLVGGCSRKDAEAPEKEAAAPGVVDYLTGAEHIRSYKKAKSKIEGIKSSLEQQYQEMEDN